MKQFLATTAFLASCASAMALGMPAPTSADPDIIVPDSTGFTFTDIKILPTTSVKDQNKSGTCWAFSGISALEDEVLRKGGPELDLSEMFVVRQCYIDKAKKYMRTGGKINFAQGGGFPDVLYVLENYGMMPEEAYTGLNYGEKKHSHYEMAGALEAYLNAVLKQGQRNNKLSESWLKGFTAILDSYLGEVPEEFTYKGKKYTPKSFAKEIGLDAADFMNVTSFNHHPFYKPFALEIADNWLWASSQNLPLEDFKRTVDYALDHGYTVAWAADVSEGGFDWRKGYALMPMPKDESDMTDTELSRWVQLSDRDREKSQYDIHGPVKEIEVTQESRQKGFDNFETTDDHGMVIVGYATDQEGNRYYKVKNSWDTNQLYKGYFYVSEPYFLAKTISFMINKDAMPKDIAKKLK